uniref:Uncharacterized protein n=1 Tax=Timema shepardi TaxID=629360 RepID=A0A7R9AZ23_TIMSH|nr:unnamed protein product [Timema shepardi]
MKEGQAVAQLCRTVSDVTVFGVASKTKHEALKSTIDQVLERGSDYASEVRNSPMASLVLTDSSQLTSDSQHLGIGKVELEQVNSHLRGGRVENLLGEKTLLVHPTEIRTLISPSSAFDLITTSALANYATEAG